MDDDLDVDLDNEVVGAEWTFCPFEESELETASSISGGNISGSGAGGGVIGRGGNGSFEPSMAS